MNDREIKQAVGGALYRVLNSDEQIKELREAPDTKPTDKKKITEAMQALTRRVAEPLEAEVAAEIKKLWAQSETAVARERELEARERELEQQKKAKNEEAQRQKIKLLRSDVYRDYLTALACAAVNGEWSGSESSCVWRAAAAVLGVLDAKKESPAPRTRTDVLAEVERLAGAIEATDTS